MKDNLRSVYLWYARDQKILPKLVKDMPEMSLLRVLKLRNIHIEDVAVSIASEDTDLKSPLMALEELKLAYCDIAMDFPTCPKLKSFTLKENWIYDSEGSVRKSILNQGESLERLVFFRHYTPYDNQGFLELIQGCRKLIYLKLAIRKVKFTLDFVREIVDILKENGLQPNDPLELVLDQYFKFKWLRHWLSLTANSELIRLRLENVI
ncbi:uncharacterized protein [Drosophila kikkawai]|uniref:Uncharacterized protein n=1 Tax=Drosophila kikkawai TaxID=30033 RepID=A0ABM3C5P7_DROKI|nr:uncharacterized protein LOC108080568 isoform X1 [Drosophila kikkawai]